MGENQNHVKVYASRKEAGEAAGRAVEKHLVKLQQQQDDVRIIFAAAPSQDAMLEYLSNSERIEWGKVTAFHMDEYLGLPKGAEQHFSEYLKKRLFSKVPLKKQILIDPFGNVESEISRYSNLMNEKPIDMVCLGIGENGHIAFNDPPVADFNDSKTIKVVELDEACRMQQVNDKCFESLENVPKKALTLTVPTLFRAKKMFCVVLGTNKSEAVKNTLMGPVNESCPASILTTHPDCTFYFDEDAYQKVMEISI
ncbi:MAG: glucosamine-6-phosphate deaminase [Flavobacteriaceae bacterium]|uniref:6-phosphogluconolactonase n=1 Tax=Flagellimonas TaxID=444459 RepID=UPI0025EC34AF|nr:glucosamine-6-phosphate deaminase [Allomuricauda sp.]MCR9264084.1 glucosamine-6-phosphate deaminase [Flavobacteriaceae bacterium]